MDKPSTVVLFEFHYTVMTCDGPYSIEAIVAAPH